MDSLKTWRESHSAEIAATLGRILDSPGFRKSEQCRKFLSYVVEHTLNGEDDRLKERNIGIEVFGRAPDYDTSDDPVVRVRATEIRKRLAQFYSESAVPEDVRLEIPSGSYRVEFHPQTAMGIPAGTPRKVLSGPVVVVSVIILATAAVLGLMLARGKPVTVVDQFWAPVVGSSKPVLIYCGQPVVYFLSRDVHERYRGRIPAEQQRGSYALNLDPRESIKGSDVIPVSDQFVGIGNAHTAALLAGLFAGKKKPVEIRYANDLSFTDLRGSPSVLIGAFSNLWTLEMQSGLRFVFEQEQGVRRIRDRKDNRAWQLAALAPDGKTPEDYALVSRLFDSATGQFLILAAGITQYGTRVSGEFLTSENTMKSALAAVAPGWQNRNLQVLMRTTIYKGTPGAPAIIATHVW